MESTAGGAGKWEPGYFASGWKLRQGEMFDGCCVHHGVLYELGNLGLLYVL